MSFFVIVNFLSLLEAPLEATLSGSSFHSKNSYPPNDGTKWEPNAEQKLLEAF